MDKGSVIGVVGCGAMGSGIAQVAATAGHRVIVYDNNEEAIKRAEKNVRQSFDKLVEKKKIEAAAAEIILKLISFVSDMAELRDCGLVIEAIIEDQEVKKKTFAALESVVRKECLLASNTSSLSITSIAASCKDPSRVLGIHFFNPATLMPLVEIVPGLATQAGHVTACVELIRNWGKVTVVAKDTPGFIVNRVARPFYSEALRIYDEGIAPMATIDWAMKEFGGFRMGPFELMDLIGHDVNYVVTETVWKQFYYDPKFKPSLTQKRLLEGGFLGKKTGRGFYDYSQPLPEPEKNAELGKKIFERVLVMLINEAADTLYLNVATANDIDLAMTKGVNYPKGLLSWANEFGLGKAIGILSELRDLYEEDRYRVSPGLKRMAASVVKS
jgi:3-hydroxybutyryl-CoA dehydrogenase